MYGIVVVIVVVVVVVVVVVIGVAVAVGVASGVVGGGGAGVGGEQGKYGYDGICGDTRNIKQISCQRTIGALIIRIRFWGPLYCNYNKEPPKIVLVII